MLWLLSIIVVALLFIRRWNMKEFLKLSKKIKCDLKAYPLLGHAYLFIGDGANRMKTLQIFAREAIKNGGHTGMWLGGKYYVVQVDAVDLEVILKTSLEKDNVMRFARNLIGNGVIFAPVAIWRPRRKVLAPAFNAKNMNSFVEVFVRQGTVMASRLNSVVGTGAVSVWKYFTTNTFDSICETALGVKLNSQLNSEEPFLKSFEICSKLMAARMVQPWLHSNAIYTMLPYHWNFEKNKKVLCDFLNETIKSRRKVLKEKKSNGLNKSTKYDMKTFLEVLIETSGGDRGYSDLELLEETLVIVLAGTDTSAVGLSFAVSMMAKYPDVQEKLFNEWLVSQGKIDKALTIMKKFERINKTKIPEKVLSDFTECSLKTIKESEAECRSYSVLDLFKTPRLRKNAILLIVIWMAISLVFDGHVRNVGSLGLDIFLTFTIASATELPADTFLTAVLDRWGRRWLACGSMVISGIFSLLATAVPVGGPSASLAILGRFAVNISYNIGLQYAAELLPTVVRAQGVALIHIMGYVASIVAPFIVYLANISQDLPLLILGVLGIFGGLLCLFLPETMDTEMPQTLADGENFGKNQKFWDNPCFPRKTVEEDEENPGKYTKRSSVSANNESQEFVRAVPSAIGSRASIRASIRASTRRREVNKERNEV